MALFLNKGEGLLFRSIHQLHEVRRCRFGKSQLIQSIALNELLSTRVIADEAIRNSNLKRSAIRIRSDPQFEPETIRNSNAKRAWKQTPFPSNDHTCNVKSLHKTCGFSIKSFDLISTLPVAQP